MYPSAFSYFTVAIDLIVQSIKDILANEHRSNTAISKVTANQNGAGNGGAPPPPLVKRGSDSKTARLH